MEQGHDSLAVCALLSLLPKDQVPQEYSVECSEVLHEPLCSNHSKERAWREIAKMRSGITITKRKESWEMYVVIRWTDTHEKCAWYSHNS
jgi:hypothetical protein